MRVYCLWILNTESEITSAPTQVLIDENDSPISIPLGLSAEKEFERMRPLADCMLKLKLYNGSEASLLSHKALLGKDSRVIGKLSC